MVPNRNFYRFHRRPRLTRSVVRGLLDAAAYAETVWQAVGKDFDTILGDDPARKRDLRRAIRWANEARDYYAER